MCALNEGPVDHHQPALGYVNPRLSDEAEQVSSDYEENAEFIKFFLPAGEIDIVVGTALTERPFEVIPYAGRDIKCETCAEIIAKKMWHRGNQAMARDLFDLRRNLTPLTASDFNVLSHSAWSRPVASSNRYGSRLAIEFEGTVQVRLRAQPVGVRREAFTQGRLIYRCA